MNNLILNQTTMSSIQLSELIHMDKKEVHRKIKSLFPEKILSGEFSPTFRSNGQVDFYLLPELESKMFVAKNDIAYLEIITRFWIFGKEPVAKTALELAREQVGLLETIENQAEALKSKDQLLIATNEASIKSGEILVREFVKSVDIIDIGEKLFYEWLRKKKYITLRNEPYQSFVARGYFTYKPSSEQINGKFRYTLRITARGKVWLSSKYMESLDSE